MSALGKAAAAPIAAMAIAVGIGSCGGGDGDGEREVRTGGHVRVYETRLPDRLDPQLSASPQGWRALWLAYLPLLTYRHAEGADGAEVVPGLAEELPEVSVDGRTYELTLRRGMRYADGTPIRAGDFERALERLFARRSAGAALYTGIVGAEAFAAGVAGSIAGIETNDRSRRITITLRAPRGDFPNALALPFAAPVPGRARNSGRGSSPPPASGPFRISTFDAPDRLELARNPRFRTVLEAGAEIPSGDADRITVLREPDLSSQVSGVARDRVDLTVDSSPSARTAALRERYGGRVRLVDSTGVYYLWMNAATPPFNDLRVRQAVNYAIDRQRVARLLSDQLQPRQQILPGGIPGHQELVLYPGPDRETSNDLLAEAHPTDLRVTVWTSDEPRLEQLGAYYRAVLVRLGFDARLEVRPASSYERVVGEPRRPDLDTGVGTYRPRYPHPNEFFATLLSGEAIGPGGRNLARVDIPELNREIERLGAEELGQAEAGYAELDRSFMEQAVWAPLGQERHLVFVSDRIDSDRVVLHPVFGQDYSSLAPAGGE